MRTLRQGKGNRTRYQSFVLSSATHGLRHIEVPSHGLAEALADAGPMPLETLEFGRLPSTPIMKRMRSAPPCQGVVSL